MGYRALCRVAKHSTFGLDTEMIRWLPTCEQPKRGYSDPSDGGGLGRMSGCVRRRDRQGISARWNSTQKSHHLSADPTTAMTGSSQKRETVCPEGPERVSARTSMVSGLRFAWVVAMR